MKMTENVKTLPKYRLENKTRKNRLEVPEAVSVPVVESLLLFAPHRIHNFFSADA